MKPSDVGLDMGRPLLSIPHSWYIHLRKSTQTSRGGIVTQSYLEAVVILALLCQGKRPHSYQEIADEFGIGKDQARNATKWLAKQGFITLELRTVYEPVALANVLFVEPVSSAVASITYPVLREETPVGYIAVTDWKPSYRARRNARIIHALAERDGGRRCRKCGSEDRITIDHVFPRSRGGKSNLENLQLLCHSCNARKCAKIEDTP